MLHFTMPKKPLPFILKCKLLERYGSEGKSDKLKTMSHFPIYKDPSSSFIFFQVSNGLTNLALCWSFFSLFHTSACVKDEND